MMIFLWVVLSVQCLVLVGWFVLGEMEVGHEWGYPAWSVLEKEMAVLGCCGGRGALPMFLLA